MGPFSTPFRPQMRGRISNNGMKKRTWRDRLSMAACTALPTAWKYWEHTTLKINSQRKRKSVHRLSDSTGQKKLGYSGRYQDL